MTPQAELRKLIEFVEFTTDNLAVVLERIEELAKQNLIPAYRLALLQNAQECLISVRDAIKEVLPRIGVDCWTCKHRKLDDWHAERNFCKFYPSFFERETLRGEVCSYYEEEESVESYEKKDSG